ncbi:MAG: helix-turn-helix transcriptional regulator, partial [Pseudonocardiales bacterium]|nr:helix-turn-helix transcriptional regulator [Pseudonocardiales bacterium]
MPIFCPDKIKDARLDAGLSRRDLAFAIGRSPVAIKSYETGFREPPAGALGL